MKEYDLTVLMPVYNAEKFLKEAIDSILQQTFTNFEFLIIDDGSTDLSKDIVRSYSDPRIRFIENEKNVGISATLNKGIDVCRTELIARMDADDISYPDRLQKQYDFFAANPGYALLSTWAREVAEDKKPLFIERFNSRYYYYILNFECWIYHPTVMFKRTAVIDVGKYSVPFSEDFDLWWKISRKYKICNFAEVLVDYRSTDKSLWRVTRKIEYETSHKKLIVRNVHFYTGEDFLLTDNEIEALRYNCEPLLKENSFKAVKTFLSKLSYISNCILNTDNVNRNIKDIKQATTFKEKAIIDWFMQNLSKRKKLLLLLYLGRWKQFFISTGHSVRRQFRLKWWPTRLQRSMVH